ncbi:MAG: ligase [Chloroflexota bacterium]|nr:ligase [Chloroflexota bacterium]
MITSRDFVTTLIIYGKDGRRFWVGGIEPKIAIIQDMDDNYSHSDYEQLKQDLHHHNYRYHVLDDPLISDAEFDKLLLKLRGMEEAHPDWITPDSPTQRSGAPPAERFEKVRHPAPILSLANAFSEDDLRAWYERIAKLDERVRQSSFVLEPKIDGLTVVLHYRNGVFVQGATRGDGEVGEDITANLRTVKAIPLKIPVDNDAVTVPETLVVRAEAFIMLADFEKLNQELADKGEKVYQNPRNTAAGSLRQLDSALVAQRPLTILSYAIVTDNPKETQWETLQYLKDLGFPVSNYSQHCANLEEMLTCTRGWQEKRDQIPFDIDGVVIKLNDLRLADELGFVGKDPRGAIALKFPAQEVTTQLNGIGVNVGRTGVLTPYAMLEPVEIGGVTVKQATLHNFDYIAEKDIRVGDRVLVKRAGDVIPYIIGPITDARSGDEQVYEIPQECPVCHQPVESIEGEVAWYCINSSCPAQIIRNIEHYVSRGAMDIVGLGIKIVEQLVEAGLVHDVADLYTLKRDDLLELEGFKDKKADNLLEAIEASKTQTLGRLITALGIRGIGEVAAEDLAQRFNDLDALAQAGIENLEAIEGFGPNMAEAVVDWFGNEKNQETVRKLKAAGVWPVRSHVRQEAPQTLAGLKFVVTGTLAEFTRDEIKDFISRHGGKVSDSVSKQTNYLVVGENAGSKLDKARALGVSILSEADLRQLAERLS